MTEHARNAASRGKVGARQVGAFVCAVLMHALRGLAAVFEGAARLSRTGARQLERVSAGARSPAPAPVETPPAPPAPVPAADKTIVAAPAFLAALAPPSGPVGAADKTIVAAPASFPPAPPALPPPRPNWGRGPVLPPPRRSEWRAALDAKRPTGEVQETSDTDATVIAPSDGNRLS